MIAGVQKEFAKPLEVWIFQSKTEGYRCVSEMLWSPARRWAGWQQEVGRRALPHSPALGVLLLLRSQLCSLILALPPRLLTVCFMGFSLSSSASSCCNSKLLSQYIQYVFSQWFSAKEISCSYSMLVDMINTWELLCKMRFRLSGLRVVSCKFIYFFPLKCLVFFCFQIEDFNWFEVFLLGIDNAEASALRKKKK